MIRREFFLVSLLALGTATSCANAQRDSASSSASSSSTANSSTYSYRCEGEDQVIVVTVKGDRGHLFSKQASQSIQRQSGSWAFVGEDVYYLPAQPPDLAPGQTAEITIKGKKMTHCKNNPRVAVWEGAKFRGVSYRALGQEPPWLLEIDRENGFLLVTQYGESRQQFPYVEPVTDTTQRSSSYASQANGEGITITIKGVDCRDSMSGEVFSSLVEINWREQTLRGCGRPLH